MKPEVFRKQVVELMTRVCVALETPEGQPILGAGKDAAAAPPAGGGEAKETPAEAQKEPAAPKFPTFEEASLALREHAAEYGMESAEALAIHFGADPKEARASQIAEEKRADFIKAAKAGKFTPPGEAAVEQKGLFG